MSNTNRGREAAGRGGRDNDTTPTPPNRDRGRGHPPPEDELAGREGRGGQRQAGPPPMGGTRNLPTRSGWNSSTKQGGEGAAQGSARAAAAVYEAQRRERATQEKTATQAGHQNPRTQQKGGALSSSHDRDNRRQEGTSNNNNRRGRAGPDTIVRSTQPPQDDGKPLPPLPNDPFPSASDPSSPTSNSSKTAQRTGTSLPMDLPTTYYEALRLADAPSTYIDYPARIHHLKYPSEKFTPAVSHKWEDIHLHQKVSSPRLHMRWTRPATTADTERSRDFFVRFHAAGYEPFMGFRPYTDILFLDGQYMAAVLGRASATPETDADSLVPFLTAADRVKIRILAVAASAFASAERARVCTVLVSAFPGLSRVFLTSLAPVERPPSAAWDLETEFARWIKVSDAARVEVQRTEEVVGSVGAYGVKNGLTEEEDGTGGSLLSDAVEVAFVLARESGRRTAQNREEAEQALGKQRDPVDWDKVDYLKMLDPRTSTSDRSSGSSRSSGVARKIKVEPYIMLYFQDAYDRAVSKGLSVDLDLTSVDHLDLRIE